MKKRLGIKAIDILKKAEEIENNWIIVEEETTSNYGVAIKLTGDPEIKIAYFTKRSGKITIPNDKYMCIDVKCVDKLIKAIKELVEMEV